MAMKNLWHLHHKKCRLALTLGDSVFHNARDASFREIFEICPYKTHYLFSVNDLPGGEKTKEARWCEEHLEGKFITGIEFCIGDSERRAYGLCFELESDLLAFKMVWAEQCI